MSLSVAVVGAGIVGLSTAINIQTLISGVKVTIIADSFGRDTTTPLSPGLFLPIPSNLNMDQVLASEWLIDGWEHHYQMAKSPEGETSGQTFLSGHCLWSKPMEHGDYIIPKLVQDYKPLSDKEIQTMSHHKFGARFTTVAVDMGKYLPWLMKEFRSRGGNLISDIVYSLQELYGKYDIVVNCTGVRAREVVNDPGLMQVKAHALQVSKQWKKEFLIMDNDIFILPHKDSDIIDVGFFLEPNVYLNGVDEDIMDLLIHKVKAYVPHLVGSEIVKKWAARTPLREPPMVEMEMMRCGGGPVLPVVHNIGLGAGTVSLAWGAGSQAAHLVQDIARLIKPFARVWRPFLTLG